MKKPEFNQDNLSPNSKFLSPLKWSEVDVGEERYKAGPCPWSPRPGPEPTVCRSCWGNEHWHPRSRHGKQVLVVPTRRRKKKDVGWVRIVSTACTDESMFSQRTEMHTWSLRLSPLSLHFQWLPNAISFPSQCVTGVHFATILTRLWWHLPAGLQTKTSLLVWLLLLHAARKTSPKVTLPTLLLRLQWLSVAPRKCPVSNMTTEACMDEPCLPHLIPDLSSLHALHPSCTGLLPVLLAHLASSSYVASAQAASSSKQSCFLLQHQFQVPPTPSPHTPSPRSGFHVKCLFN